MHATLSWHSCRWLRLQSQSALLEQFLSVKRCRHDLSRNLWKWPVFAEGICYPCMSLISWSRLSLLLVLFLMSLCFRLRSKWVSGSTCRIEAMILQILRKIECKYYIARNLSLLDLLPSARIAGWIRAWRIRKWAWKPFCSWRCSRKRSQLREHQVQNRKYMRRMGSSYYVSLGQQGEDSMSPLILRRLKRGSI